jgi:hypothetical protein
VTEEEELCIGCTYPVMLQCLLLGDMSSKSAVDERIDTYYQHPGLEECKKYLVNHIIFYVQLPDVILAEVKFCLQDS